MTDIGFPENVKIPTHRRLNIFSVRPPRVTERNLSEAARQMGLARNPDNGSVQLDEHKITYKEGHHEVILYRASGGLRYRDRSRWQVDDGRSNLDMSDARATELARGYIRKLKIAPLKECRLLKVTRLHVATSDRKGIDRDHRVVDVGVAFQRTIDGVPVDGPGGKVIVYLDHRGELTGIDRLWRVSMKIHRKVESLRSMEATNREVSEFLGARSNGRVQVLGVRFGYFEMGWRVMQPYLQPAYVVLLMLRSTDERVHRRSVYVAAAATNAMGRITPLLGRKKPQARRAPD